MCAGSKSELLGHKVNVYMGYYGGKISVGDNTYSTSHHEGELSALQMIELLSKYKSEELATLIVDLIDNAEE